MDITTTLRNQIAAQKLPCPSHALLASLTARSPLPPPPSLVATAKARLLACDLTTSDLVDTSQTPPLPAEALDAASTKELVLQQDTHLQVLDVENLSLSRWEQIEELEAIERGERTQGRQIIRVSDDESDDGALLPGIRPGKMATHRLVVQDWKGARLYAVELVRMAAVGVAVMGIGCKMLVRSGTVVARGTVLLTPENCLVLGGRIDAWHDAWAGGRLKRLREAVGAGHGHGHGHGHGGDSSST